MGLIPQVADDLLPDLTEEEQPSYTYAMGLETNRISGKCSDLTALKQAIYKIVNTERYSYPVYSDNYGIELKDLVGMPETYCMAELERRIREALIQDDRIDTVDNFTFKVPKKGTIYAKFRVTAGSDVLETEAEFTV